MKPLGRAQQASTSFCCHFSLPSLTTKDGLEHAVRKCIHHSEDERMSDNWAVAVEEELLKRTHDLGTGVKECVDFRNLREMSLYSLLASVFGEGNGTPLQYSCLENPMDGEAWWAAVHGVAKSWAQLIDFTFTFHFNALEKEMTTHSSVLA